MQMREIDRKCYKYLSSHHVLLVIIPTLFLQNVLRQIHVDYSQNLLVCKTVDSATI